MNERLLRDMPVCYSIMEDIARLRDAGSDPHAVSITAAEWLQLREELGVKSDKVGNVVLAGVPVKVAGQ